MKNRITVVITNATHGAGKATAVRLAQMGVNLVLAGRSHLIDGLTHDYKNVVAVPTDVSREADLSNLAATALKRFGRIDLWINNAGLAAAGKFESVPLEDHFRVIESTLHSVIIGSHIAMKQFKLQGSGTLINIGCATAEHDFLNYASYAAAKYGVIGFGEALLREVQSEGYQDIKIHTLHPNVEILDYLEDPAVVFMQPSFGVEPSEMILQ